MSRKTRAFRVFLHQNQNPTVKQAWDAAWKRAQKAFYTRSMRDMEEKLAAAHAECERLREQLRLAQREAAPAAPVAQGYDALCGIEWKPQGEANEYILLRGARWVAGVRFNGELLPEAQEEILKAMLCDKNVCYGDGFHDGYWKGRADMATEQQGIAPAALAEVDE